MLNLITDCPFQKVVKLFVTTPVFLDNVVRGQISQDKAMEAYYLIGPGRPSPRLNVMVLNSL